MKVKGLINKLNKLDSNLEIVCYSEDMQLKQADQFVSVLDIREISVKGAEKFRNSQDRACLKFTKSKISQQLALIDITTNF